MNLPKVTIEQLLEAGVHFGHNIRRWDPRMEQYIFGVRNKIHIIDLRITLPLIDVALSKLHEIVSKSGKVLIVGTKKQCSIIVKEISLETQSLFVNKRWLGGTLTNWKTISKSINKLEELEIMLNDNNSNNNLSKKELLNLSREKDKLISNIGGIRTLEGKPDILIVFDVVKDKLAVLEANKLSIPVIAIVDTNANPDLSLTTSNTIKISGLPSRVRIPPILEISLSFSRDRFNNSFFDRLLLELLSLSIISSSSNLFMDLEIVFQLVSVPPNHLLFTNND
jgi:small subunit ribosomal protein S2